jgi:hypothetical protein
MGHFLTHASQQSTLYFVGTGEHLLSERHRRLVNGLRDLCPLYLPSKVAKQRGHSL